MRVKAIKNILDSRDKEILKGTFYANQDYHFTVGKEYIVLGISFKIINNTLISILEHLSDYGHITSSPLFMFNIINNNSSKFWKLKLWDDGSITQFPELFYQEYFHDEYSDRVLDAVNKFKSLYNEIQNEDYDLEC